MNFNNVEFITSYGKFSQIPTSDRPEIAFSGRSNVGKSSLINKIFNRKSLARVSSMPGKTVTINFFSLENIYIADLPGYGYAKVGKAEKSRWAELIGSYLIDDRAIELVFQLIDMRHPPTADDLQMIDFLVDNEIPFVIVLTKSDKLNKTNRLKRREGFSKELPYFDQLTVVEFSAQTGEGVEKIREIISEIGETAEKVIEELAIKDSENDTENSEI